MNFNLKFYWKLLLRRLPAMMALLLLCTGLSVAVAMRLPETYTTSARLLVEAPQIPDNLAASTVRTGAIEQLQVIEQRLLTRANLIDIANRFDVFSNIREMDPDAVVAAMRKKTRIRRSSGRNEATLMTISFETSRAKAAADVVNEYVTQVLEDNARVRTEAAGETLLFFQQELERLGLQLDQQSARIVSFKNENSNALPDDLNYRLGRQSLLQERLGRLERDISALSDQRAQMVAIFESTGRIQPAETARLSPEEQRLNALRQELEQALAIYSDTNPRVRLLQSRVSQLENTVAANAGSAPQDDPNAGQGAMLNITLTEIDSRIETMEREASEVKSELDGLETSIKATPANGIALDALERDYANIRTQYNNAVRSLNQAQTGERIEVSAKGQRISVIEAATVPRSPSGPNRIRIIILGIGAGLAAAGGLFVLLEILNRSIRRPVELTSRFGISPLATIPYMETPGNRMARRALLVTAFLVVLIGVPAGLWAVDTYYLPLELLATRVAERLGLS